MWPWLRELFSFVVETPCPLCQRSCPEILCRDCHRQLQAEHLPTPDQYWQPPQPTFSWGGYQGSLKRAIAVLKYQHQPQIAQPLGQWLAQAWLASPHHRSSLVVVPIPIHVQRLQERGYNQADLLAHAFCRVTQLPLQVQGFKRIKTTTAQYSLSLSARQQNLQGAFQVEPALQAQRHRQVLLLDDIYTTGTTIQSAWEALTQQGFTVYGTVTVARTQMAPPRHSVKLKPLKRG